MKGGDQEDKPSRNLTFKGQSFKNVNKEFSSLNERKPALHIGPRLRLK